MLLEEVNVNNTGTYDFFYLPIDFKNKCNVGYGFINFLDPSYILPFLREFEGARWKNFNSEKVCSVTFARIQGKAAMVARFQNSSLLDKDNEYKPLLFYSSGADRGLPEPFPTRGGQRVGTSAGSMSSSSSYGQESGGMSYNAPHYHPQQQQQQHLSQQAYYSQHQQQPQHHQQQASNGLPYRRATPPPSTSNGSSPPPGTY